MPMLLWTMESGVTSIISKLFSMMFDAMRLSSGSVKMGGLRPSGLFAMRM